ASITTTIHNTPPRPPRPTLFPYTTLFRSRAHHRGFHLVDERASGWRWTGDGARRDRGRSVALARGICRCCSGRAAGRRWRFLAVAPLGGELFVHTAAARFKRRRQVRAELFEKLVVGLELLLPGGSIDARELRVLRRRHFLEPLPVQVLESRHGAERRFDAAPATLAAL